jgi:hypothetical protein
VGGVAVVVANKVLSSLGIIAQGINRLRALIEHIQIRVVVLRCRVGEIHLRELILEIVASLRLHLQLGLELEVSLHVRTHVELILLDVLLSALIEPRDRIS